MTTILYLFVEKNGKKEKCLELLYLARKLIEKSFQIFLPPSQKKGLNKTKKCLELPDLARKLIRKTIFLFSNQKNNSADLI